MSTRRKSWPPSDSGQDKRQAVIPGMELAADFTEEILSTGDLYSGQPYQRPVLERAVDKLVRAWDQRLLTPLVVSYRDGRYNLVDGQHRVCAMRKMNGGKDVSVLCKVYHSLSYQQEAELYFKMDQAQGRLRLSHAMKALLESGNDAEAYRRTLRDRIHPDHYQQLPPAGRCGVLPHAVPAGPNLARHTQLPKSLHALRYGAVPENL